MTSTRALVPCLCYRDAPAAIDWLYRVFGFTRYCVVPGDDGAAMVVDIADKGHGGYGFTCRDIEGHVWSVGT